jgi:peptidoglycan/xylan/chitin deacetylase (PgdA/CDA1 family)
MRPIVRPLALFVVAAALLAPATALAAPIAVQLTAPAVDSLLRRTVGLKATAPGADSVTFQLAREVAGPYRGLATDDTAGDGWKASWDTTTVADGTRFLRARADGPGGRSLSDPIRVAVDNTAPVVTVGASPAAFSPNGDRVKDRTVVTMELSEPAALELDLVNAAGRTVHRLAPGHRLDAGIHRFDWGGMVNKGGHWTRAQDGVFDLRAAAVDTAGNTGTGAGTVRLDTVAPGFKWRSVSPEPAAGSGPVTLSFESFDPGSSVKVSASIWNDVKRVAFVDGLPRPTGPATVQVTPPSSPPPGLYRAQVTLVDEAGNKAQGPFLPFRIQHPVTSTVVRGFTGVGNRIALSFDDCIFGDAWNSILDALEARGLRATFFCASSTLDGNAAQARRTIADGMSIGSHTRDHPVLTNLSYSEIRTQLQADIDTWWRIAHATPLPLFRPPYGAYDSDVLRAAGDLGFLHTVTWDVDPQDWSDPGVAAIQERVLSHAHAGMVVVMHVKPETAAALPGLLDALAARGYHQTAIDDMFRAASGRADLRFGPAKWAPHRSG